MLGVPWPCRGAEKGVTVGHTIHQFRPRRELEIEEQKKVEIIDMRLNHFLNAQFQHMDDHG